MADIQKGNVCKCARGVVGIVFSIQGVKQKRYRGLTLDGRPWESKAPTLVSETILAYLVMGYNDGKKCGYTEGIHIAQRMIHEVFAE